MFNKKKIQLETLVYIFIILCPILDIISFLFRNYFSCTVSPSTIIRPIIPIILFMILFFKEKSKTKKMTVALIYIIYVIIHLMIFQKLHNKSSYGNIINEIQYIVNYSFMIINLYIFIDVIKEKVNLEKAVGISLVIYICSLFISIITNTSSSTYLEGIGYKGYFESGNSLCTVLLLSICILLPNIKLKDWNKIILIIFTGIYLCLFSEMRTGLFGFSIIMGIYIIGKIIISVRDKVTFNKKQIVIVVVGIILAILVIFILGSKTLERRAMLKQNEQDNIDEETGELRYVSGDILKIFKQIQNNTLEEQYMSEQEKNAITNLCEIAENIKLSNVNLRAQQFIYNVFLVKEQKNLGFILFGNGYKNQTGELVMEMELLAILLNFGILGFILYFGPFFIIFLYGLYNGIKNRNKITINYIMYISGIALSLMLSLFSGYVYFNFSSMTMCIILYVMLLLEIKFEK